ncbi:MAG: SIMPL domain-containing protein [Anaerolineae bacterium]|nr:SIMPL domain-containing protein [Anaerolineae bacterium]MDW8068022.1 SIMPL domain-containing protein [Anaerolineae bacterium]
MKPKFWLIALPILLMLVASACGQAGASPTLAAGEPVRALGGGGIPYVSAGTITQGVVATGTATVSAEPEIVQVVFGVDLRGDDPAAVVNEAAQKINRAIAAARGLGVAEKDIQTTSYNVWVESLYDPQTGQPTGEVVYRASHYVMATLRDLGKTGDLLAAVVEAGANSISGVSFTVENPDALVKEARQKALENARAQAEQMAQVLGIALGKPVLVSEGGGYPVAAAVRMEAGGGAVEAPSIAPGAFSVTVSVQVVYEIR